MGFDFAVVLGWYGVRVMVERPGMPGVVYPSLEKLLTYTRAAVLGHLHRVKLPNKTHAANHSKRASPKSLSNNAIDVTFHNTHSAASRRMQL